MNLRDQFKLAWRNLWRNRRRSVATILSLAFGFTAIALFAGYSSAVYSALANTAIHGELIGHLTINRKGWDTEGKLHPEKYLLDARDISRVGDIVSRRLPGGVLVPKLGVVGLLSNGRSSTIFVATGIAPKDLDLLRGPFRHAPGALKDEVADGVTLGQGLADVLGLKAGESGSVLANTIHGQANAADAEVIDTVTVGSAAVNDKLMLMPLAMAQGVLDAPGRAESLTLMLPQEASSGTSGAGSNAMTAMRRPAPDEARTAALCEQLSADFAQAGLDLEVRSWQQMSAFYRQVKGMYDMVFALMLVVVLAIVGLAIASAMGMAVVERTREIGTLRAIGLRRGKVTALFVCEALLLVVVGIAASLAMTLLIRWGVNAADLRFVPPGNTSRVPIYIGLDFGRTAQAGVLLAVLAIAAAFVPARRAARQSIPQSLGHV